MYWFSFCRSAREIKGNRVGIPNRPRCCKLHFEARAILLPLSAVCMTGRRPGWSESEDLPYKQPSWLSRIRAGHLHLYFLLYCESTGSGTDMGFPRCMMWPQRRVHVSFPFEGSVLGASCRCFLFWV